MVREYDVLLTPGEVAKHLKVDPKTVTRWCNAGRLPSVRTLGGHRRIRESDLIAAMAAVNERYDGGTET